MKINNLKINGFGNLEKKEIDFKNGINIIYGKNESGKSTLLKYIISMFYGLSKNKKGKDIADIDKYIPWNAKEFSGKLKYSLDDKSTYEVFREFGKKNIKLYNESLEDISKKFTIDKIKGNDFFYEQTKMDEELFLNTALVYQSEMQLEKSSQNSLLQKITNLISSGDDNISLKKSLDTLNKKMLEEVGTERSSGRPLNLIEAEIKNLDLKIAKLENKNNQKYIFENGQKEIEEQISDYKAETKLLKDLKELYEKDSLEREKLSINKKLKADYETKIIDVRSRYATNTEDLEKERNKSKFKSKKLFIFPIISLITSGLGFGFKLNILGIMGIVGFLIGILIFIIARNKFYTNMRNIVNKINQEHTKHKNETIVLEDNKKALERQIGEAETVLNSMLVSEKEKLRNIHLGFVNILIMDDDLLLNYEEVSSKINELQEETNDLIINKHKVKLDEENLSEGIEKLAEYKERLDGLKENREELLVVRNSIVVASQGIQQAYNEIKNSVTPKFTENLSKIVEKISNSKYKAVNLNDEKGLIVELNSGEYVNSNVLSTGTIDQMYIALRISVLEELTKENMPLILDEPFVYFDNLRLQNILKYINEDLKNKQILIFTCSKREIDTLDTLNIKYNKIEI